MATRNDPAEKGWLLFIHQLPPKPDYLRVKVRRRLLRIGAVALKNTVYVLPATGEAREDFRWLRREIQADGGDAMVFEADIVEGVARGSIERQARMERDEEYRQLARAAEPGGITTDADIERLRRQLAEIVRRDHFRAPGRAIAESAIQALLQRAATATSTSTPATARPSGATWVTREGVGVDRMASAWLIRGWIDQTPTFRFVPEDGYTPRAGELRFDMFEGEFTHAGDRCTFEVLLDHFGLSDPALRAVAEVVHDIDCKDGKFGRVESDGIAAIVDGIVLTESSDEARLDAGAATFSRLHATFRQNPT